MKASSFIFFLLLSIAPVSHAADHPIDSYLASCIDADSTTTVMITCTNQATSMWDKELNGKYAQLLSALSAADRASLRQAQRQWIQFRDAEFSVIDSVYRDKMGTMYLPMRAADRLEIVKAHVLQLTQYANLVDE